MISKQNRLILAAFAISLLLGCSGSEPGHPAASQQQTAKALPPPPPPPSTPSTPAPAAPARQEPFAATPFTGTPLPATPVAQPPSQPQPAPSPNLSPENAGSKKAQVGVGKKLSRLSKSLIAAEFASLYCVRERVVFDMQIPKAMQLFKAMEGRAPNSHKEFMEKIIKEGQIHLPELFEGETYRYDTKTEELWVDPPPEEK